MSYAHELLRASALGWLCSAMLSCAQGFSGSYSGLVTTTGRCDDGSQVRPSTDPFAITITTEGTLASWQAACGVRATARTDRTTTAHVEPFVCPATTSGGVTSSIAITDGTLTLSGTLLQLALSGNVTVSGAAMGRCAIVLSGTLSRQE